MRTIAPLFLCTSLVFAENPKLVVESVALSAKLASIKGEIEKTDQQLSKQLSKTIDLNDINEKSSGWLPLPSSISPFKNEPSHSYTFVDAVGDDAVFLAKIEMRGRVINRTFAIKKAKSKFSPGSMVPLVPGAMDYDSQIDFSGIKIPAFKLIEPEKNDAVSELITQKLKQMQIKNEIILSITKTLKEALETDASRQDRIKIASAFEGTEVAFLLRGFIEGRGVSESPKMDFINPSNAPQILRDDPKDTRPYLVRSLERAIDYTHKYEAKLTSKEHATYNAWKNEQASILKDIEAAKAEEIKSARLKFIKEAESKWPIPPGTKSIDRAKYETKHRSWAEEQIKPIIQQVNDKYRLDSKK